MYERCEVWKNTKIYKIKVYLKDIFEFFAYQELRKYIVKFRVVPFII